MEEYPRVVYGHDSSGDPQCPRVDASGVVDVRLKDNDASLEVTPAASVSGWKTATITVAEDDDLSDEVDLGEHYRYMAVILPALTEARVGVQVATESGGTYYTLGDGNDAMTALTTGGYAAVFDIGGWRHVKISTSAAQAADREISVQGVRG